MAKIDGLTIFTEAEFDIIVNEVLNDNGAVFDTLLAVIEKAFRKHIEGWCARTPQLRDGGHEDDIMQEIFRKVIKSAITNFFKREELGGETNYDPLGFQKWLFTVVKNAKKSYFNYVVKKISLSLEDEAIQRTVDNMAGQSGDYYSEIKTKEELEESFRIVIESDARPYTVLTWIAQCLFFIKITEKGGEISGKIDEVFANKTLYEMRDWIFAAAKTIVWMKLTEKGIVKINNALDAPYDEAHTYGEMLYKDFYMKKGPKSTISDWINKMNNIIKKQVAAK